MSREENTLFLRLAGPMQSWGTSSRFQLRRTDSYPSKSGVLGLLLCAKGIRREESRVELERLADLTMGVRVDRKGSVDWDYHTAGAKIGIWQANRKKLKKTASTGELETLVSRRQYLYDASFLVALQGPSEIISEYHSHLENPKWPVFLGRKCCVPSEPVCAGCGCFEDIASALSSVRWYPRIRSIDRAGFQDTITLDTFTEHPKGGAPPSNARLVHDVPRAFGFWSHAGRWVVPGSVTVPVGEESYKVAPLSTPYRDSYGPGWEALRKKRLELDSFLCVFCKSPAAEVHHLDYGDVRIETVRSLCNTCHSACTMLEYGNGMRRTRVDPQDPTWRSMILDMISRSIKERRRSRHRELLAMGRSMEPDFFEDEAEG